MRPVPEEQWTKHDAVVLLGSCTFSLVWVQSSSKNHMHAVISHAYMDVAFVVTKGVLFPSL
jgi:hypothetical protein